MPSAVLPVSAMSRHRSVAAGPPTADVVHQVSVASSVGPVFGMTRSNRGRPSVLAGPGWAATTSFEPLRTSRYLLGQRHRTSPAVSPVTTTTSGPLKPGPKRLGDQVVGDPLVACRPGRCRVRAARAACPVTGIASSPSPRTPTSTIGTRNRVTSRAQRKPKPSLAGAARRRLAQLAGQDPVADEAEQRRQQRERDQHGDGDGAGGGQAHRGQERDVDDGQPGQRDDDRGAGERRRPSRRCRPRARPPPPGPALGQVWRYRELMNSA